MVFPVNFFWNVSYEKIQRSCYGTFLLLSKHQMLCQTLSHDDSANALIPALGESYMVSLIINQFVFPFLTSGRIVNTLAHKFRKLFFIPQMTYQNFVCSLQTLLNIMALIKGTLRFRLFFFSFLFMNPRKYS